ncbi:MAG: Fic family protein [Saprospiraceae bacterium]|nr:Fic family protein [Saprospiraceae bacterium]
MKPPYDITNTILNLITEISEKIGEINAHHLDRPSPELRKRNRVKTIKASLEIEGNTLSERQITAIIENKRVIGPKEDIVEVINAIDVYEKIPQFDPSSVKSFLKAHQLLMKGLIDHPGKFRSKSVGIVKGKEVAHVAPPPEHLPSLVKDLFAYYNTSDDPVLIKSCVIHYEIEFIHPFMDGNGRMGRLWQTLILMKAYPLFEFLPFETIIKDRQKAYYKALELSDKKGKSTRFIEFILTAINESLDELLRLQNRLNTASERISYFIEIVQLESFTRKDYINVFKDISTATASRDLRYGVEKKMIVKEGDKRNTKYKIR